MDLIEWFAANNINPEGAVFFSAAPDGLNIKSNKLMAYSFKEYDKPQQVIYIDGANPDQVVKITGVSQELYDNKATDQENGYLILKENLERWFKEGKFIVTFNSSFQLQWINKYIADQLVKDECPPFPNFYPYIIDFPEYIKLLDKGEEIPEDRYSSIAELSKAIHDAVCLIPNHEYGLQSLLHRYAVSVDHPIPELEKKVLYLENLYKEVLVV